VHKGLLAVVMVKKSKRLPMVECPECGSRMFLRETKRFKYPNGGNRKFWGCGRWPETGCQGIVGAHPDGRPLGRPVDKKGREARQRAHAAFDVLWQHGGITRKQAYRWLSDYLGVPDVHISDMTVQECDQVVDASVVLVGLIESDGDPRL